MTDILDQATVHQEFTDIIDTQLTDPLRPHIAGGHAELRRYPDESTLNSLGDYDPSQDVAYNWPNRSAGSVVDLSFVQLWMENALLRYFQELTGTGDTIAPVSGYKNRVNTDASNGFVENPLDAATYPRLAALYDRDVQVGDTIRLRGGTPTQTLTTTVKDILPDTVAAVVGSASADSSNAIAQPNNNSTDLDTPAVNPTGGGATGGSLAAGDYYLALTAKGDFGETWWGAESAQFTVGAGNIPRVTLPSLPNGCDGFNVYLTQAAGAAGTETLYASDVTGATYDLSAAHTTGTADVPKEATQTAGTSNDVLVTDADDAGDTAATAYKGIVDGDLSETYTIVVTTGSTGGDATTAVLQVTTASGRDDDATVTPAAFGSATAIGSRGLEVTWDNTANDFVVGQTWQVVARELYSVPTATSGGTYTADERNETFTYKVLVTRGGYYADANDPQITVTRDDTGDSSGPTDVTAAATNVIVGTRGVLIQWSSNGTTPGLRKNDQFYITITSAKDGSYKTIELNQNMNTTMLAAADLELNLYIKKAQLEIPEQRASDPPNVNWVAAEDTITTKAAIDSTDESLTDNGAAVYVPVVEGTVYAHYRAWLPTYAAQLNEFTPTDESTIRTEVEALLGTADPDNPLSYAVWKAATNCNLQKILYTAIADPSSLTQWTDMLAILEGIKDVHNLVPLSHDEDVLDAYTTHINARSLDSVGGEWRRGWYALQAATSQAIVDPTTSSDLGTVTATLSDHPGVSGTQYTYLESDSLNGQFVTNGVQAGDIVRYLYTIDGFGEETYTEFVVESVVNEDTLVLQTGHSTGIGTGQRVEIHRNYTPQEIADVMAATVTATANERILYVWPDLIEDGGLSVDGYFLTAALAGYVGGIAPHQDLQNLQITGFDGVSRSISFFNNAQLNTLDAAGAFVVTIDSEGNVFTRNSNTTDQTDVETGNEMVIRNKDMLRHLFYRSVSQYFGKANTSASAQALIRGDLQSAQELAKNSTRIERLGPALISSNIAELYRHATSLNRIVAAMEVELPYPAQEATITLEIPAASS